MKDNKQDSDRHFKIHIHHEQRPQAKKPEHAHGNVVSRKVAPHKAAKPKKKPSISLKGILEDTGRQIVASAIILVIGFFALNWSAYSQIVLNKLNQWRGYESPLNELVEENGGTVQKVLLTSSDPEVQKKQIPDLNLEVSPIDDRIIIPRINQNIPIVRVSSDSLLRRDWNTLEDEMQAALQEGVVHYPGTSLPGNGGNTVITGHSSYFPWDPGRFKDVFALLHDVEIGDKIVVYYNQDKYIYEISDIETVSPDNIEVLKQTPDDKLTLITCTPVGTNVNRLIVKARPIEINGKDVEVKILR